MTKGKGLHLRRSLGPGRWREILAHLRMGNHFKCHKTTVEDEETGEAIPEKGLVCRGAHDWQMKKLGQPSQLVQVMQRLFGGEDASQSDTRVNSKNERERREARSGFMGRLPAQRLEKTKCRTRK